DPASGQPVEIVFIKGRTLEGSAVLFLPSSDSCSSVIDEWCPNANLFETETNARAWAGRRGIAGEVLSMSQAVKVGANSWRQLVTRGRA
ncbi:organomercurial lyase, partial [Klebsiella pneumoniae]|uniref:organomercurial lyase n=1 Tax=Klebsiella pneumoniae TaxID=573 RepID=UPI003013FA7A